MSETDVYKRIPASRRVIAGIMLALANFMVVLDLTIANVSVPHIAGNLGISPHMGTWVITSYAVAEAISVPLTGWLAMRFGSVRTFIFAMIGFGVFSFLCGVSQTLGMLVACRIGQGLCGGPLMPMSQMLMLRVFPPEHRGRAMSLWAMTTLLGPALGPILGGYISDNWSWHWIFFINLPICAMCVFAAFSLLRPVETERMKLPIDRIGLILLIFFIGSFQLMLDLGRDHDWFADPLIVTLAVCAAVGFGLFVIWELTEEHPIVDLRIFRHRGFTMGVIAFGFAFGGYFASIVLVPQWLQTSLGYTAMYAGFATAFTAFTAMLVAPIAGRLLGKIDARIMVSAAVAWLGVMSLWRSGWTSGADFWTLAMPQIFQGFAMAFMVIPLTSITLAAVEPHETTSAAGLQNFLRTMAVAIATSLSLTSWESSQRISRSELVGKLQPEDTQRILSTTGVPDEQARQMISTIVEQEAISLAINSTFIMTAIVLFAAATVVWLAPKGKEAADVSGAH